MELKDRLKGIRVSLHQLLVTKIAYVSEAGLKAPRASIFMFLSVRMQSPPLQM